MHNRGQILFIYTYLCLWIIPKVQKTYEIANPIDWLYATCQVYFCMQTINYALDRTHCQGPGWVVPFDLSTWT